MSPASSASQSAIDWPWQTRQRSSSISACALRLLARVGKLAVGPMGRRQVRCRASTGAASDERQERVRAASSRLLQLGEDRRHIGRLDRADMLVADDALAIDDEALGHARRAERDLDLAVGSLPMRSNGSPWRRGTRRRPRAGRGWRCRRSSRPCASARQHGASAMHGTHQLAKMLTRRGSPVARSADVKAGRSGDSAAEARRPGPAGRRAASGPSCRPGWPAARQRADEQPDSSDERQRSEARGSCVRPPAARRRRASVPDQARAARQARSARRRARSGSRTASTTSAAASAPAASGLPSTA